MATEKEERPLKRHKKEDEDVNGEKEKAKAKSGEAEGPKTTLAEKKEEYGEPIARFDYQALGDLAKLGEHLVKGFLVTCPFRREKSATVEAIKLIEDQQEQTPKEVKLSLVKCHMKGKLFIKTTKNEAAGVESDEKRVKGVQPTLLLRQILEAIEKGKCFPPQHCLRLFPVQALCLCEEDKLEKTLQHMLKRLGEAEAEGEGIGFTEGEQFRFAVGGKAKAVKLPSGGKVDVVKTLAGAFQSVYKKAVVSLKEPQLVILYESLHISQKGVKNVLIALSLCHQDLGLIHIRPKGIGIRPLFNRN